MSYKIDDYHKKILDILVDLNGEHITLAKLGKMIGLNHGQKVLNKLNQLEKKGYIRKNYETKSYEVLKEQMKDIVNIPVYGTAQCGHAGAAVVYESPQSQIPFSTAVLGMLDTSNYFLIKAQGDSMLPLIKSGDLVLVRQQSNYDLNDKVLIVHNEIPKVKKITSINKKRFLISLNSDFADIEILPYDSLSIVGIVKKIISEL